MTPAAHARALLARIQTTETAAREAMRAARYALDDMASAHETMRQLRAELAAVLGGEDVPRHATDPIPTPEEYARIVMRCGRPEAR